jgi:tripartite ATP-independent transporter DctM subunit
MGIEVVVLLSMLVLLLVLRVPIAIALAGSATVIIIWQGIPVVVVVQRLYAGTESWVLMAIPFFILAGAIMEAGGMSRRLVDFANALFGFMRGGLANVNIGASMLFGGISGSAVADTSALGSVLIPAMEREGYPKVYAAAVTASSSPIGMIIPPSIPMIVWSFVSGESLGALFLGGVIPGALVTLSLMSVSTVICVRRGYQAHGSRFDFRALRATLLNGIVTLGAPVIIIGGIVFGIFTPTEAAVIAVAYSLLVTTLVYREFSLRSLPKVLVKAGKTSATVMFVVAGATVFSWILALNQVPQTLGRLILGFADSPGMFMFIGSILLFILGMFLDTTTTILLVGPVLAPLARVVGVDPILAGLIFLVVLATGLVTPPLGLCLFVGSSLTGTSIERIAREVIPFVLAMLAVALILWFVPQTVTWLPSRLAP